MPKDFTLEILTKEQVPPRVLRTGFLKPLALDIVREFLESDAEASHVKLSVDLNYKRRSSIARIINKQDAGVRAIFRKGEIYLVRE